jgi:signal transduction histidine kinase
LGDFAIGNEAREFRGNAESEPFAGCIDEVRISSIPRNAGDFLFGSQTRRTGTVENALPPPSNEVSIRLDSIKIDGRPWNLADVRDDLLLLPPGQHRIDLSFSHLSGPASGPVKVTYQLAGADDGWRVSTRGMQVICQFLDDASQVVSQSSFPVSGTSPGWEGSVSDSKLLPRRESLMVPGGARHLKVRISSGTPDTTGTLVLDDFQVTSTIHGASRTPVDIWRNTGDSGTAAASLPHETPQGWEKGPGDPSICRMAITSDGPMIALVDGDSDRYGEWVATKRLPPGIVEGRTLVVSWREVFNIIEGQQHLAAYLKVPPGEYTFQTSAIALTGTPTGHSKSLRIRIPQSLVQRPWFAPVLVGGLITLVSSIVLMAIRQRGRSKVERLRLQTELERDRTRIARDMHDDLGTVATAITMTAALASRNLAANPEKAAEHLRTVGQSARRLVGALDDLVWTVDPSNDTLDELGVHLTRLVEDLFTNSGIRHRIRIPGILPRTHLGSEVRHHLALAVKEALHNVLRHSAATEVNLAMDLKENQLQIEIRDNGRGFSADVNTGNGLVNMRRRLELIGGKCEVHSRPNGGTAVRFELPHSPGTSVPHPAHHP